MEIQNDPEKIRRRMYIIERCYEEHRDRYKAHGVDGFALNHAVLRSVVLSYFHDIMRMKDFHGIEYADKYKQAAYTVKWIIRLRPFGFNCPEEQVQECHLIVNEALAWRCALAFLEIVPDEVPRRLFQLILYSSRYRTLDEDSLLLFSELLDNCVSNSREWEKCREQLKHCREHIS